MTTQDSCSPNYMTLSEVVLVVLTAFFPNKPLAATAVQ